MSPVSKRSMAAATTRLVSHLLLMMALLPPLLLAAFGALVEREKAQATAAAIAAWAGEAADRRALQRQLAHALDAPHAEARAVLDRHGLVLASAGDAAQLDWPTLGAVSPLSGGAGTVEVRRSLRGPLDQALLALLACAGGALAIWRKVFVRPMGALRRAEGQWRSFARRDALTGLLNRDGLRRRLERALLDSGARQRMVGLLMIDLDRFHSVNDSLGPAAGDELLCSVADRIRAVTREADVVARLGGDQFVICVEGLNGAQAASTMARNLLRAFEPPYWLGGRETVATPSIGVAVGQAGSADELLNSAEAAMRVAKRDGGGRFRVYDKTMDADAAQALERELRLRRALQADEFFLVYQPIVDAQREHACAIEALLRWADPQRGVVSPAEFIPVLERTGLIVPAGRWVLQQACRRGAQWIAEGAKELVLSVNVSPLQFAEPDFVDMVRVTVEQTGFPAAKLQLEVTEGLLLDPTPESLAKLDALAALGVRLAVDDFGMGYSSLAYLKQFRLHSLKIDRMFVRDIAHHSQDAAIVRAIIDLGHGLGMHVTAEGVETAEQAHALRRLGCDSLQGFLFARPVAEDQVSRALLRRARLRHAPGGDALDFLPTDPIALSAA